MTRVKSASRSARITREALPIGELELVEVAKARPTYGKPGDVQGVVRPIAVFPPDGRSPV